MRVIVAHIQLLNEALDLVRNDSSGACLWMQSFSIFDVRSCCSSSSQAGSCFTMASQDHESCKSVPRCRNRPSTSRIALTLTPPSDMAPCRGRLSCPRFQNRRHHPRSRPSATRTHQRNRPLLQPLSLPQQIARSAAPGPCAPRRKRRAQRQAPPPAPLPALPSLCNVPIYRSLPHAHLSFPPSQPPGPSPSATSSCAPAPSPSLTQTPIPVVTPCSCTASHPTALTPPTTAYLSSFGRSTREARAASPTHCTSRRSHASAYPYPYASNSEVHALLLPKHKSAAALTAHSSPLAPGAPLRCRRRACTRSIRCRHFHTAVVRRWRQEQCNMRTVLFSDSLAETQVEGIAHVDPRLMCACAAAAFIAAL